MTACDAGTANYILPLLKKLSLPFSLFAQGEAASIFRAEGIDFTLVPPCNWSNLESTGEYLLRSGIFTQVIAGTSWGATIDKAVTLSAIKTNIPTIAIIEHWNLYKERFSIVEHGNIVEECVYLPDSIWVNDSFAKEGAVAAGLPEEKLFVAGQPFLEFQYNKLISRRFRPSNNYVVFVSERIKEDFIEGSPMGKKYNEYTVLELLMETIDFSKNKLLIKLHPQEKPDKYDYLKNGRPDIEVVKQCDIAELILESHKIVGMGSMLLLEAALVRSDVISVLPDTDPAEFIGNKIGATLFASDSVDLRKFLGLPPALIGTAPFGNRFLGANARLLNVIETLQ